MIHVYLDDFRPAPKGFTLALNADECMLLLEQCEVDVLSLDYDLGWGRKTGYDIAVWMVENKKFPREIYLHSSNLSARLRMYELLDLAKPDGVILKNIAVPQERLDEIARAANT